MGCSNKNYKTVCKNSEVQVISGLTCADCLFHPSVHISMFVSMSHNFVNILLRALDILLYGWIVDPYDIIDREATAQGSQDLQGIIFTILWHWMEVMFLWIMLQSSGKCCFCFGKKSIWLDWLQAVLIFCGWWLKSQYTSQSLCSASLSLSHLWIRLIWVHMQN